MRIAGLRSFAMTPDGAGVLSALTGALAPIATPTQASLLAELVTPARPLALVLQGLAELERHARAQAAHGRPWSPAELARKALTYAQGARAPRQAPVQEPTKYMPPEHETLPPMRERARATAPAAAGVLAVIEARLRAA